MIHYYRQRVTSLHFLFTEDFSLRSVISFLKVTLSTQRTKRFRFQNICNVLVVLISDKSDYSRGRHTFIPTVTHLLLLHGTPLQVAVPHLF